jgi:hypothetical protein
MEASLTKHEAAPAPEIYATPVDGQKCSGLSEREPLGHSETGLGTQGARFFIGRRLLFDRADLDRFRGATCAGVRNTAADWGLWERALTSLCEVK